jgi:hypothetical protein
MRSGVTSALSPTLRAKFQTWVQAHIDAGCGNPLDGCACACHCLPEPVDCGTCLDRGFVKRTRDIDDARFGKAEPCPDCTPAAEVQHWQRARLLTGMEPDALTGYALTDLDPRSAPRLGAELWIANGYQPPLVTFAGPYGTGKTHAAWALAGRLLDDGLSCWAGTAAELLQQLRDTFSKARLHEHDPAGTDAVSLADILAHLKAVGLLVLDDLGAEKVTDWTAEQIFTVVNHRLVHKRATIVTTNLDRKTAPDDRLWSRVLGERFAMVIQTTGPDRRRDG